MIFMNAIKACVYNLGKLTYCMYIISKGMQYNQKSTMEERVLNPTAAVDTGLELSVLVITSNISSTLAALTGHYGQLQEEQCYWSLPIQETITKLANANRASKLCC